MNLLKVVAIVGYRKSGKTEVIERLIKELRGRGYRVGTIKHVREKNFTIDQPGKDTWRHAKAGAEVVVSLASREVATVLKRRARLEEVIRVIGWLDFLVLEGFREAKGITKVAIARTPREASKLVDKFTIACIGYGKWGLPVLKPKEVKKLANLIERRALPPMPGLNCRGCGYSRCEDFVLAVLAGRAKLEDCQPLFDRVKLTVDGKPIPLNPFMQELIAGTIRGMLSSLKGAKGKRIELRVS